MKTAIKITVLLLMLSASGYGCRKSDISDAKKDSEPFSVAVLGAKERRTISKSSLQGKVVLLSFWATWCPPCIREIPVLTKIQEDFLERGFEVLGMNVDTDDFVKAEQAVSHFKVKYTLALADKDIQKKYSVNGIPYKVLLDREGNVRATYRGNVSEEQLRSDIQKWL